MLNTDNDVQVDSAPVVLEAQGLTKHYRLRGRGQSGHVRAADDVTFALQAGRVTAVVGESGSGKSTVARMLARLVRPTAGRIVLEGEAITRRDVHAYRSAVQLVFQDPFASFNPAHNIRYHLERPLRNYRKVRGQRLDRAVDELLERVRLDAQFADKYPYELSGGQLQRAAIARALAAGPRVLLADEPVSMLDVSIRLGILNLLEDLRDDDKLAILYVTHDIASARYFADTIIVMYAGQVIERGPARTVTDAAAHPYTQLLLSAAPDPERIDQPEITAAASGAAAANSGNATGCRFMPRCPFAMAICTTQPPSFPVAEGHSAACWLRSDELSERESASVGAESAR